MLQNIIVFTIVTFAVIYMVRKLYLQMKGKGGCDCGSCSCCNAAPKNTSKQKEMKQNGENTCSCCKKD